MFVKDFMTTSPITIPVETPILEALSIMRKRKVHQLPVLNKGKLVGLVAERELLKVSPSPATTLSVYEINYLLSKMTVKDVLVRDPISVTPDCTIEEAALQMREHRIRSLLVVDNGVLKGIITQTDVFEALIGSSVCVNPGSGWCWKWKTELARWPKCSIWSKTGASTCMP